MANYCVPEKGRAALLTVSAQRDYVDCSSPFRVSEVSQLLPAFRRVAGAFRDAGAPVYHAVRLYRADGSNVDMCRRQAVEEGLRVCMPGTLGAELLDELKPNPDVRLDPQLLLAREFQDLGPREHVFYRPRWGAFYDTRLEDRLRAEQVTTLVVCGANFTAGVRATVYEASERDYRIILITDAVGDATEDGISELARLGVYLMPSEDLSAWLARQGSPARSSA